MPFEIKEIPFEIRDNRQCLTELQLAQEPWLREFIIVFANCFEHDPMMAIWWYDPEGKP